MTTILNKKNQSHTLAGIICAVLIFGCFAGVNAQEPSPVQAAVQKFIPKVLQFNADFNLSDEQKKQVVAMMKVHKADIQAEMKKSKAARQAFNKEANKDLNSDAAKAAAAKIGDSAASGAILRAKIFAELKTILDEDQQKTAVNAGKEVENLIAEMFGMIKE